MRGQDHRVQIFNELAETRKRGSFVFYSLQKDTLANTLTTSVRQVCPVLNLALAHLVSLRACTMGVMTDALDRSASLSSKYPDDGILARIPGQFVVQASKSLPDPACALDDEMSVEVEAAWVGPVRLTFKKQRYSRPNGKIPYVAWLCRHAEPIAGDESSKLSETKNR